MPIISGGSPLTTGATATSTLSSAALTLSSQESIATSESFFSSAPAPPTTPASCLVDNPVYTTAFIAPKDCSLQYSPYASTNNNVNTTLFLTRDVQSSSCYPLGWYSYCVEQLTLTPLYYYSPKVCPDGYSAATTQLIIGTTSDPLTTTILGCCESDLTKLVPTSAFGNAADALQSCVGNITKALITLMYNSTSATTLFSDVPVTSNGTFLSYSTATNYSSSMFYKTTTLFVDAAEKTGLPIWVGWTDVSSPKTKANIANATATTAATPTSFSNSITGGSHGLSTGTSAGIGVGAGIGGLLLLTAAFLGYRRRHNKPAEAQVTSHEKPELSEDAAVKPKELSDVQEKPVHEADTVHPPVELG